MVIEESKDFASRSSRRKRSSSEMAGAGNDAGAIDDVYVMRQLLLNFLASTKSPLNKAAREVHLAQWIEECEQARRSSDGNIVIDAEVKEASYLDLWHLPNQDGSDNAMVTKKKYLTDEGNGKLMESLAAINSDLSTSFPRLLGVILGLMGDPNSTVLRKLALKAISTIMLVDPKLMHQKMVSAAVAQRFQDEAISVREASVSLVGTFVLQSPNSAVGFYPLLLDKLHDEGVSVRKRAIKIFRDLMLTTPSFSGRAAACSVMLQRAADPKEDDGVRDLIHETFQALWFDTAKVELAPVEQGDPGTKPTRRRHKKATSASEQRLSTASSQMVEVVGCSGGKSDTLAKLVKELLFGFGEGQSKGGAAARKKRHESAQSHCTKIVSALIELILSFEEERAELDKEAAGKKLVALLATLEVFAESSPTLLIAHIDTILPYLKGENGVSRDSEAAIAASVSKIISRCSQHLNTVDAERLSNAIVGDLSKVINRLGPNAMSAAIEALSKLAAHPDAGTLPETKLLALAKTFYAFLYRACDTDIAKLKASNRGMIHRALSALGSICRFHEFSEITSEGVDLSTESSVLDPAEIELTWTNIVPAAYSMLALYLNKDHGPTRCQALKGLNGIFVAQPRLLLAVEQTGLIADVMDDSSGADLQLAALSCWRELLVCEEKRIESGEAKEQMEARQDITVSKRISGDQDEDASLVGGVMAQHSKRFYQMLMSPNVRIRAGCLDLMGDLLRQGLINPIQTIPFLLALQGDVGAPDIRAKALKLLVAEGEKRPDSLRQRVKVGCKEAFNFQRKAHPDKPVTAVIEKKSSGSNKIECIFDKVFIESIRSSKANRHGLFNSLLSLFEVDTDIDAKDKKNIGRARKLLHLQAFAAQVLATLPYTDLSDALYIVYHINARLSDAEMFAEKMADFLRPHGLAPSDMYDILDDDEDIIEEAAKAKDPRKELKAMASSDFDADNFADLCASASALVLLMKLKSHLVNAFSLKSDRIQAYNPSEKSRPHDKAHTSSATSVFSIEKYVSGGSRIEECIARYAIWRQVTRASHREEVELSKAKNSSSKRKRSGSTSSADDGESEDSSGEQSEEEMEE
jgi:cohesin loading factor subunit SCC2